MSDLVSLPSLYKLGIIRDISRFTFSTGGSAVCAFLPPEEIYLSAIVGSVLLGIGLGIIFGSGVRQAERIFPWRY
jgi:uncharacterized membrane-anchored protein YitT (DUF2179 family)